MNIYNEDEEMTAFEEESEDDIEFDMDNNDESSESEVKFDINVLENDDRV